MSTMKARLKSSWNSFRSHAGVLSWRIQTIFGLLILLFLIALSLPNPSTLMSVDAYIETIDIEVTHPAGSVIYLENAYHERRRECVSNITVYPAKGAIVTYTRITNGPLYVSVRGEMIESFEGLNTSHSNSLSRFIIDNRSDDCKPNALVRLPANGVVSIGQEAIFGADTTSPMFLEGTISVYNRSLSMLFGVLPLDWGPFEANALYLAEQFSVPSGSRLQYAKSVSGEEARWWGFVDVNFEQYASQSLQFRASSNALSIQLFAPAPSEALKPNTRVSATENPELISMSFGSRLAGDPNLRWLYGIVVGIGFTVSLAGFFLQQEGPRNHGRQKTSRPNRNKKSRSRMSRNAIKRYKKKDDGLE